MRPRWLWLLALWPLMAASDADEATRQRSERHEYGRSVYNSHCYFCHGYGGDARTLASTYLRPPPRNFKNLSADDLGHQEMLRAVRSGRPGTAMVGFRDRLSPQAIEAVVGFIHQEFIVDKKINSRYHTGRNGWSPAEVSEAIPFATQQIPVDARWENLAPNQRQGKRIFLSYCVTCHDNGGVIHGGPIWQAEAASYPPGGYLHHDPNRPHAAPPYYLRHQQPPTMVHLSPGQRRGEQLFQSNCASCHAADGSGRNWVGSFISPPPPDFTDPSVAARFSAAGLVKTIREGRPGTAMPAWGSVLNDADIEALIAYLLRAFPTQAAAEY